MRSFKWSGFLSKKYNTLCGPLLLYRSVHFITVRIFFHCTVFIYTEFTYIFIYTEFAEKEMFVLSNNFYQNLFKCYIVPLGICEENHNCQVFEWLQSHKS